MCIMMLFVTNFIISRISVMINFCCNKNDGLDEIYGIYNYDNIDIKEKKD